MVRFSVTTLGMRVLGSAAALVAVFAMAANAQTYPDRPVRIVIPAAPAGVIDTVARLLQPGLEKALGQPIVIEHRPGAGGAIGVDAAARAAPDGHTLVMIATAQVANAAVNPKTPYDLERDLTAVAMIGSNPLLIVVNAKVQAKTLPEFVALAKKQPGKLNYASVGRGSFSHLTMARFLQAAGIEVQDIHYRGGGPAIQSLIAGETQVSAISPVPIMPHIQAGTLRPLAATSATRDPQFHDLPTVAESGYPGFEATQWVGLAAPAKTPPEVVRRLNAEINKLLRDGELAKKVEAQGMALAGGSAESFAKTIATELRDFREVARQANITAQ